MNRKLLIRKKKALKEINKISLNLSEEILKKLSNENRGLKTIIKNTLKHLIKKNLKEVD